MASKAAAEVVKKFDVDDEGWWVLVGDSEGEKLWYWAEAEDVDEGEVESLVDVLEPIVVVVGDIFVRHITVGALHVAITSSCRAVAAILSRHTGNHQGVLVPVVGLHVDNKGLHIVGAEDVESEALELTCGEHRVLDATDIAHTSRSLLFWSSIAIEGWLLELKSRVEKCLDDILAVLFWVEHRVVVVRREIEDRDSSDSERSSDLDDALSGLDSVSRDVKQAVRFSGNDNLFLDAFWEVADKRCEEAVRKVGLAYDGALERCDGDLGEEILLGCGESRVVGANVAVSVLRQLLPRKYQLDDWLEAEWKQLDRDMDEAEIAILKMVELAGSKKNSREERRT